MLRAPYCKYEFKFDYWCCFLYYSIVITELPPEHAKRALELLCLPAINPLQVLCQHFNMFCKAFSKAICSFIYMNKQEITNQGGVSLQQVPARQLTIHIDRLACIFRL